ncbi:Flp pilus assembly complex ATPase component TadA [bacterium]|nr:Flp pilus assembly complex ATPase component TadA [bacterium]
MADSKFQVTCEAYTDSYGVLPLEIKPFGIGKWLNTFILRIHADRIEVLRKSFQEEIFFSNFKQIEAAKTTISITHGEIEPFSTIHFKGVDNSKTLKALLEKLISENLRWEKIKISSFSLSDVSSILNETLAWRGHPFVAATEFLLNSAFNFDATDFHLEPASEKVRITFRIGRELCEVGDYSIHSHRGIVSRMKYLAKCQSHLSGIPQEGSLSLSSANIADARVSVFPSTYGERCSVRIIKPNKFPGVDSLGWDAKEAKCWRELISRGPGLLVISGPVGSGKTTTLYATLSELAQSGLEGKLKRIVTLEDPVEGRVHGVCQASLDSKSGLGLAQAFKHLLRQDPDIIALGEIRDAETLKEALQAGLAGHLVFTTFHSPSPEGTIHRMLHMGLERHLLKSGLRGIINLSIPSATENRKVPRSNDRDFFFLNRQIRTQVSIMGTDDLASIID